MSDTPHTVEQIRGFMNAANSEIDHLDEEDARLVLQGLRAHGIQVTFPEPRYRVVDMTAAWAPATPWWEVRTRELDGSGGQWVARFYGPGAETYAREHAARLNA